MGKVIVGNWKMNGDAAMAESLLGELRAGLPEDLAARGHTVAVAPPFPYLPLAVNALAGSPVQVGAQNVYPKDSGAFTGEVSPFMLKDVGVTFCIVGHSERRHILGESDDFVRQKLEALLAVGLSPVLCVGETLGERQSNQHEMVVARQLETALRGQDATAMRAVRVAYEPVWAIGTGHHATPEQAQAMHASIRKRLREHFGEETAAAVPLLYGGSVNPDNARGLLAEADIDGVLVGGASLKADSFLDIVRHAQS